MLIRVRILSILSPDLGPDFIKEVHVAGPVYIFGWSGSGFYLFLVRSGFYHVSPGPNFIHFESGTDFIMLVRVRILSILSPDPGPDLFKEVHVAGPVPVPDFFRVLSPGPILSIKSGSGYYLFLSPGPDFIKHVRIRVRILPRPGSSFHKLY